MSFDTSRPLVALASGDNKPATRKANKITEVALISLEVVE
jgi:hypothetical protein